MPDNEELSTLTNLAYDYDTLAVNDIKYGYFVQPQKAIVSKRKKKGEWKTGQSYDILKGKVIEKDKAAYGYIRIYSFSCDDADLFVEDLELILRQLRNEAAISGLIMDIRGNGGGLIPACEQLLARLKGKHFEAQRFQFLHTDRTIDLLRASK